MFVTFFFYLFDTKAKIWTAYIPLLECSNNNTIIADNGSGKNTLYPSKI